MKRNYEFNIIIEKENVFKNIGCIKGNESYTIIDREYTKVINVFKDLIKPKAIYKYFNYNNLKSINEFKNCVGLYMSLITLGEDLSKQIQKYFDFKDYTKAILLDSICVEALFNFQNIIFENIRKELEEKGLEIISYKCPGDEGMPLEYQSYIFNEVNGKSIGINLTEGYMLNPIKSMAGVYGVATYKESIQVDNSCIKCNNNKCTYRKKAYNELVDVTIIKNNDERIFFKGKKNDTIMDILLDKKIQYKFPCLGEGNCGKCKVTVVKGVVKLGEENFNKLSRKELDEGICLACRSYLKEDITIKIPNERFNILTSIIHKDLIIRPHIETKDIFINMEDIKGISLTKWINSKLAVDYVYNLNVLKKLSTIINEKSKDQCENSLYNKKNLILLVREKRVLDVFSKEDEKVFAVAVDLGTTTIALSLINLQKGEVVSNSTIINSQRSFGLDVISRIQYSGKNLEKLTEAIRNSIKKGIEKLSHSSNIKLDKIYHIAVSGNTTMVHLFLGLFCESMGQYPFNIVTKDLINIQCKDLFKDIVNGEITILPNISAFVGGDVVCGILNSGMYRDDNISILIDIGTNGEIVIGNKERILCTSVAAGPALEGGNIYCGMDAVDGAIYKAKIKDNKFENITINNKKPIGICGSGVIDIVSEGIKNDIIDETGRLIGNETLVISKENGIVFTQKDIREVQLAKSAIRSGIEILIKKYGCEYKDISNIYLAGGYGNSIDIDSAINIGIIPCKLEKKVKLYGNTSLGGCIQYILNKDHNQTLKEIISKTHYVDISREKNFNDLFIDNMLF
ncbi:ASKHA domain-containing protein [Clostridium rectalis]|uniref:ASKHA domain-containing protein n=1 Tax=Clostridium rectalis TaxID=2040295 RepID=UPI000F64206D|nr:ASKHA domain-containing protein [Clostridium rectalis]